MSSEEQWKAPKPEGEYRGFGSVPGETQDEFHHRMFDIPLEEAIFYEQEFEKKVKNGEIRKEE